MPLNIPETTSVINPYCFRAYDSGGTTLTDASTVDINLATESYDYNNNFASSTYTAPFTGVYHFDGKIQMTAAATPVTGLAVLRVNDGGAVDYQGSRHSPTADETGYVINMDLFLNAGATVKLGLYQNTAGNEATTTGSDKTYFSGHLIHRTA